MLKYHKGVDETEYIKRLKDKRRARRVTEPHQFTGLAIAETLHDEAHKSLYIKLAKQHGGEWLLALAKDVAERKNVKNKGAYFMKLVHEYIHDRK